MNKTNDKTTPPPSDDAGSSMLFTYTVVIIIFVGLVGHSTALVIFSKSPFRKRPVTVFHISMSVAALLLSVIGNTLSLVYSFKRNDQKPSFITMCKVSAGLEISGVTVYTFLSVMMMAHSYFMTSYHATSSTFYVPRRIEFMTVGITISWICGLLVGISPSWLVRDFVIFESQVTCQLSWVGNGKENAYWVLLFIFSLCVPGLISLTAYRLTHRLVSGSTDTPISNISVTLHSQIRSNKLNNRLVLSLFIATLPYSIFGLLTTIVGDHFLPPFLMLFLEIISKCYVIHGPFIFLARSKTYRAILGNILSTGSFSQVVPTTNSSYGARSNERCNRPTGQPRGNISVKNNDVTPMPTRMRALANA